MKLNLSTAVERSLNNEIVVPTSIWDRAAQGAPVTFWLALTGFLLLQALPSGNNLATACDHLITPSKIERTERVIALVPAGEATP
jgi:hypothetical protein